VVFLAVPPDSIESSYVPSSFFNHCLRHPRYPPVRPCCLSACPSVRYLFGPSDVWSKTSLALKIGQQIGLSREINIKGLLALYTLDIHCTQCTASGFNVSSWQQLPGSIWDQESRELGSVWHDDTSCWVRCDIMTSAAAYDGVITRAAAGFNVRSCEQLLVSMWNPDISCWIWCDMTTAARFDVRLWHQLLRCAQLWVTSFKFFN